MKRILFIASLTAITLMLLSFEPMSTRACCENRGDVDHSGGPSIITVTDIVWMIQYMFQGGPGPYCAQEANVNGDWSVMDVADLVYLVDYIFRGGPPPVPCDPVETYVRFGATEVVEPYNIDVTFQDVRYDQRCPVGAQCILPTFAEIAISLTGDIPSCVSYVNLPIVDYTMFGVDYSDIPIIQCGYMFTLVDLSPYPSDGDTIQDIFYRADIAITPWDHPDDERRVLLTNSSWPAVQPEQYFLNELSLSDDSISLWVGHSGGLPHSFDLYMSPASFEGASSPRRANLYVVHHNWDDILTAYWEPRFKYSLQPIADLYEELYGTLEPIEIHVLDSVFIWDPTQ